MSNSLATLPPNTDLSGLIAQVELAIEASGLATRHRDQLPYHWVIHDERLLRGLYIAAVIGLHEVHGWQPEQIRARLSVWLRQSQNPVRVYLSCLTPSAMKEIILRLERATGGRNG